MIVSKVFDRYDEEAMYEKKEGIYLIRTINSGCNHRCTRSCQHTDLCEANGKSAGCGYTREYSQRICGSTAGISES